jgi:hypothetical protein
MDRTVDAAATEQSLIRRVDDRVDIERCDVRRERPRDGASITSRAAGPAAGVFGRESNRGVTVSAHVAARHARGVERRGDVARAIHADDAAFSVGALQHVLHDGLGRRLHAQMAVRHTRADVVRDGVANEILAMAC